MIPAYHSIDQQSFDQCLRSGLKYGETGARSGEDIVRRANAYLDNHIPPELAAKGLSRQRCLYMYVGFGDDVLDIQTGLFVHWRDWDAGAGFRKLRVMLDPATGYVSDLVAYDQFKNAFEQDKHAELANLADKYWRRVVPLQDFMQHYHPANSRLQFTGEGANMPTDLGRVEIMVTQDIPPSAILAL